MIVQLPTQLSLHHQQRYALLLFYSFLLFQLQIILHLFSQYLRDKISFPPSLFLLSVFFLHIIDVNMQPVTHNLPKLFSPAFYPIFYLSFYNLQSFIYPWCRWQEGGGARRGSGKSKRHPKKKMMHYMNARFTSPLFFLLYSLISFHFATSPLFFFFHIYINIDFMNRYSTIQ